MNKKNILLGTIAVLAISAVIFKSNQNVEKQYSEVSEKEKPASSIQGERNQMYQDLYANVNTGMIEEGDFEKALNSVNKMVSKKSAAALKFNDFGPDNVAGRTRAICVDVSNTNIIFAGSVSGGLFKSTNKGGVWERVVAFQDNLSISSMDMTSNGTLYVATGGSEIGEGSIANMSSGNDGGNGMWYSTDGGVSFVKITATDGNNISTIVAHPTQNKVYFVGRNLGLSIYDGTNVIQHADISTGADLSDVEISADGNHIVCGESQTYVSNDRGTSFTNVTSRLESGSNARYAFSHEKNANGKYNIFGILAGTFGDLAGVWMSPNEGANWYEIGPGGSSSFAPFGSNQQGNYDNTITVIKGRPNEILIGGVDLWHWELTESLSNPWGQWSRVSEWDASPISSKYVHADQHEMKWDKDGNLYFGNDGGVFTYQQPFPDDVTYLRFRTLNRGYNVTQFYSLAVGRDGSMLAGAQDNGTQYNTRLGNTLQETIQVFGGDGFDCAISQLSTRGQISSIYYTDIFRSDDAGGNYIDVFAPCSGLDPGDDCGVFNTRFTLHEIKRDDNSKDSVEYSVPENTIVNPGATLTFEYASANFALPLNGSYTNTSSVDVEFKAGDKIKAMDSVQSLFALSVPANDQDDYGVFITRDIWKFGKSPEWWKVLSHENGFTDRATTMKFSEDGSILYVGTNNGDIWRVDGIGESYDKRNADLNTSFKTATAELGESVGNIIAVNTVANEFTISGDYRGKISGSSTLRVTGSTGNDKQYSVDFNPTFDGTNTIITTLQTIPDATADGEIILKVFEPFDFDFINNTYYNYIDLTEITFKINRTRIYNGRATQHVTGIALDPNNPSKLLVTLGGFGAPENIVLSNSADVATGLGTFSSIHGSGTSDLPLMPIFNAVIDKDNSNQILVGTAYGTYVSTDLGSSWQPNNDEIGLVPVYRVYQDINDNAQYSGSYYISTHGRGFWSTNELNDLPLSVDELSGNNEVFNSEIQLYPNPVSDIVNVSFETNFNSSIEINIATIQGKTIQSKSFGIQSAGLHRANLNTDQLPSGIYMIQVRTGKVSKTAKFIKL